MMNTEKNIKMAHAFAKLTALQDALAEFGIDSEVAEWTNDGNGARAVSLHANLWNCVDGSDVLFEVYTDGTLPAGALSDGFGIALKDTDFYKYNPAAQVYPENAILCLHKPTLAGRSKNEARYAEDVAFFKAIADFEVKE